MMKGTALIFLSTEKITYFRFDRAKQSAGRIFRRIWGENSPDARCPRFRHCDKNTLKSVRDHVRPQYLKTAAEDAAPTPPQWGESRRRIGSGRP